MTDKDDENLMLKSATSDNDEDALKKEYNQKYLVREEKPGDWYKLIDLNEKLEDICQLVTFYEQTGSDDNVYRSSIYHLDDTTMVLSNGYSDHGNTYKVHEEMGLKKKPYFQLQLVSAKDLTQTVEKLQKNSEFLREFKEVNEPYFWG